MDRIPAWIKWATVEAGQMGAKYDGIYWDPPGPERHQWYIPCLALQCRSYCCLRLSVWGTAAQPGPRIFVFQSQGCRMLCDLWTFHFCRQHERPSGKLASLRIYEAHVGMSSEEPKVASYSYFKGKSSIPKLSLQCCCLLFLWCRMRSCYSTGLRALPVT